MSEFPSEQPREKVSQGKEAYIRCNEVRQFSAEGVDSISHNKMIMYFSIRCTNPNGTVEIMANKFDMRDNASVDKGTTSHSAGSDGKILNSIPFRLSSRNGGAHIVFL